MTVDGHGAFRIELVVSGTPFSVIYVPIAPSLYTILLAGDLPTHEGTIESFLSTIRLGSPE
jgi:hypothetical protein